MKPRRFTFFFEPSMGDPAYLLPVAEQFGSDDSFPHGSYMWRTGWRARLAAKLVRWLLPEVPKV